MGFTQQNEFQSISSPLLTKMVRCFFKNCTLPQSLVCADDRGLINGQTHFLSKNS